jgi:hypothetical protein
MCHGGRMSHLLQDNEMIISLATILITAIMSLNAWFIRNLVIKVNKIDKIDTIEVRMQGIEHQINKLSEIVQDVGRLKERIAVLEFASASGIKISLPKNRGE